jgi:hypothetical protein
MIKVVAIDPELFADGLIRNYGAYRTWLQFFLLHMMHGFTIVVPKGKKAGFEEAALAAKDHFHRSAQGQIERYLPERIHEVNIQDAWRDDVKVCQLCRDDADAFDMLALAAGGVVDVLVARSTFSAKCANIPKWVKDKVLPWNKYPGKKYWPDLASSMGARHITDAADSDELIERLFAARKVRSCLRPVYLQSIVAVSISRQEGELERFQDNSRQGVRLSRGKATRH